MKLNLKVILYKQKTYADGSHPIILQYVVKSKAKRKVIARCKPDDWDEKKNRVKTKVPNAARINLYINEQFVKAEHDLYDAKSGDIPVDSVFSEKSSLTLGQAFDLELVRLEKNFHSGSYDKILAIRKQIKDTSIAVSQIDDRWFHRMITMLRNKGNGNSTIKRKIKLMRGMILRYSPAGVTKEVKEITVQAQKPLKAKLTAKEVQALAALEIEDGLLAATRDIFLMQIYLRGIRIGDILQADSDDFKDGKYRYKADKTDLAQSIKLIPQAVQLVEKYRDKHPRLFPFFTWEPDRKLSKFENERARLKHKEGCTTIINNYLKVLAKMAGIKKPLSSHIARHTFARMAIDKINNPMVTMELLGHSSLAVHQAYLNDIRKEDALDQAADDIFG